MRYINSGSDQKLSLSAAQNARDNGTIYTGTAKTGQEFQKDRDIEKDETI